MGKQGMKVNFKIGRIADLIEWLEGQKKSLPDPPRNRYRPEHTHNTAIDAVINKLRETK